MHTSNSIHDSRAARRRLAVSFIPPCVSGLALHSPLPPLAQQLSWPAIARGESTLLLAPTGSGKTLAAFLWCLNRTMFSPPPAKAGRCRVLYISPLKALAVDVERNLRIPLEGIAEVADASRGQLPSAHGVRAHWRHSVGRTSSLSTLARRHPHYHAGVSLSAAHLQAREALRSVETVIVDEIHALVPTKRGAHLALSLERLERLCGRTLQRIGLSATQRPLAEVARFLAGVETFAETSDRPGCSGCDR